MIRRPGVGLARRGDLRGTGAGAASTPLVLPTTDMLFGVELDTGVTESSGSISSVADLSGNGNDGTGGTPPRDPKVVTDGTLGTCANMDNANGGLLNFSGAASASTSHTTVYVMNLKSLTSSEMLLYASGAAGVYIIRHDGPGGDFTVDEGTSAQGFGHTLATGAQVVTFVAAGTSVTLYVGRTSIGSITMAGARDISINAAVGSPFVGSQTPDINLRALYHYSVALDASQRTTLWDYIAARHPGAPV